MNTNKTILSICNRCRDGKEDDLKSRGGQRLLDNFLNKIKNNKILLKYLKILIFLKLKIKELEI